MLKMFGHYPPATCHIRKSTIYRLSQREFRNSLGFPYLHPLNLTWNPFLWPCPSVEFLELQIYGVVDTAWSIQMVQSMSHIKLSMLDFPHCPINPLFTTINP